MRVRHRRNGRALAGEAARTRDDARWGSCDSGGPRSRDGGARFGGCCGHARFRDRRRRCGRRAALREEAGGGAAEETDVGVAMAESR